MVRLLQWLIFGHVHKWETTRVNVLEDPSYGGLRGTRVKLRCEICGDWKKKDLI